MTTIAVRVIADTDDATHVVQSGLCLHTFNPNGMGVLNVDDLMTGLRFAGIAIPAGATVDSAIVTFHAQNIVGFIPELEIVCEDEDDPGDLATPCDINGRARTVGVDWDPAAWPPFTDVATSSFAASLQQVADRPNFAGDHVVVIVHSDLAVFGLNNFLTSLPFPVDPSAASLLTVTFTPPPAVAPHIDDATISAKPTQDDSVAIPTDDATVSVTPAHDATISVGAGAATISVKRTDDKEV